MTLVLERPAGVESRLREHRPRCRPAPGVLDVEWACERCGPWPCDAYTAALIASQREAAR